MAVRGREWYRKKGGGVPVYRERDGWLAKWVICGARRTKKG